MTTNMPLQHHLMIMVRHSSDEALAFGEYAYMHQQKLSVLVMTPTSFKGRCDLKSGSFVDFY